MLFASFRRIAALTAGRNAECRRPGAAQAPALCRIAALAQPVMLGSRPQRKGTCRVSVQERLAQRPHQADQARHGDDAEQHLAEGLLGDVLDHGEGDEVPRMTPGAPYMAQVSTVGV